MARRIRGVALTEGSKVLAVRALAAVAVLIGVLTSIASPEAAWVAFLIALYPIVQILLFPRISDRALAIPIWLFWFLASALILMGDPQQSPPPYIEDRGLSFIVCLASFLAASFVAALEIRSSRLGEPYQSKQAFELTLPAWGSALAMIVLGIVMFLLFGVLGLFGLEF